MKDVFVLGTGQTPVGEHWDRSLRDLGAEAIRAWVIARANEDLAAAGASN